MRLLYNRWLAEQLPAWEREGIVTADGARRLRERYAVEQRAGLAQLIVGTLGALLIGTGLVALLASNWDDFPRWVRLCLALGPLAAAQLVSWWVLGKDRAAEPWQREATALGQALAAGAAMALVSQIYHLPGRWMELVFWWCVVALPLAWVFRSRGVAIAYLVGITVWAIAQAENRVSPFSEAAATDLRFWQPLLLAGILPLWPGAELDKRPPPASRLVLAIAGLVGLLAVAAQVAFRPYDQHSAFFWLVMLTTVVVMLFPLTREGVAEPLARKPHVPLGGFTLMGMALVATYEDPARTLVEGVGPALALGWSWVLLAVAAVFAVLAFRQGRIAVLAVASLALVPLVAYPLTPADAGGWPVAIAYSLVLLATAVTLIGLEFLGRQGAARIGASLITLLVILRMLDADVSLLVKGITFIVIGCCFLAFNVVISRHRAAAPGGSPA